MLLQIYLVIFTKVSENYSVEKNVFEILIIFLAFREDCKETNQNDPKYIQEMHESLQNYLKALIKAQDADGIIVS